MSWSREQITYCSCNSLSYKHAHCPCSRCNGKAVSRSTEYRHWIEANAELSRSRETSRDTSTFESVNSDTLQVLENHGRGDHNTSTCTAEVSADRSSTEELLSYEMIISQETNDASVDMELETSQGEPPLTAQSSSARAPQQDITCALTR